ncbi:MAG: LamG domain-containing protein [Opitutae bacterium]|nr:LamG domain-containing protein [Opitutae bacterium]
MSPASSSSSASPPSSSPCSATSDPSAARAAPLRGVAPLVAPLGLPFPRHLFSPALRCLHFGFHPATGERRMNGIHLDRLAGGGFLLLLLAFSAFADAQLDDAKTKYGASDEQILRESTREKDRLLDHYHQALDRAAQELQQQGRLDDYLAAKNELERLALERSIPAKSPAQRAAGLASLENTAWITLERIQQGEWRRRADLARRYVEFLGRRGRQLTAEGQIEAATAVNAEKKRVESILAELTAKLPPPEPSPAPAATAAAGPTAPRAGPLARPGDPKRRTAFQPPTKDMELCLTFEKGLADRIKTPKITWEKAEVIEDGRFGKGCRFSGNGRLTLDSIPVPDEGTWCIWARISPDADLIQQKAIIDANGMGFSVSSGELSCNFYDGVSTSVGTITPVKGKWMHLAVTWGNQERRFYADGDLVATVAYSGKPYAAKRTMQIGARWTGAERHFMGDVDELILYSRCLSPAEIALVAAKESGEN